jgi:DNA-binding HxlR family transcriptional regulator
MKSYRQACALAKALDAVGDRWSLLIIRELLLREQCRYTDLKNGLPGIATNLLADRLRELESAGVIHGHEAPPPIATTVFELTDRGRALERVILELGIWGAPLLNVAATDDHFRIYWLGLWIRHHLQDHAPAQPGVVLELHAADDDLPLIVDVGGGLVRTRVGRRGQPDAMLAGPARALAAVMTGRTTLSAGRAKGVRYTGDSAILARVQPSAFRKRRVRNNT